jgi:predicted DNA-binding transcriptional regulator AlpA
MKSRTTSGKTLQNPPDDTPTPEPDDELWDSRKVRAYFGGIHVSTLYRGVVTGIYPPPINVSPNVVRWLPHECRAALQHMIAARGEPKPPTRRGRPQGRRRGPASKVEAAEAQ